MTIKLITFKTAHTILGDVTETSEGFKVKEPVQVIMQPSKEGPMMAFAPFLEYDDRESSTWLLSAIDAATNPAPPSQR